MKYNQPFDQPSSPNAPYIDGNPGAGIQGSIVPAASIEFPQREIMSAITAAGLAGTNADLTQLLQMLKIMDVFNKFKFANNQGNASQWSASIPPLPIMPPPAGTAIWFAPLFDSVQGGTVFSVNGSTFRPVTNSDGSAVGIGDVLGTGFVLLFFDGTSWRIVAGTSSRVTGALPLLQKNTHWYVNNTTGNDTTLDGTSATVVTAKIGPFKTIQRASDEVLKYNMNGYNQFIHVADGSYIGGVNFRPINGTGTVFVIGNPAAPQNVVVTAPSSPVLSCGFFQTGGYYDFDGFRLSTPAGALDGFAQNGGVSTLHNMRFGPCARYHISSADSGSTLIMQSGTTTIEAGATAVCHMVASLAALITFPAPLDPATTWPSLNILGAVTFSFAFIEGTHLGIAQMHYLSITGAASVTGPKYYAAMNGAVDSFGGGSTYFPGSTGGTLATGGQYGV